MPLRNKAICLFLYSLAVKASGLYRFLAHEGGEKGLWFGLIMGSIGVFGGIALLTGRPRLGYLASTTVFLFVGGWFAYESFVLKGWSNAEIRQLLVLAATLVSAFVVAIPSPKASRSFSGELEAI